MTVMKRSKCNESGIRLIDKYRGCLLGGAVGDALGFAVEFMSEESIRSTYGESGITSYKLLDNVAQISDDTQMTLFTANGLLLKEVRSLACGDDMSHAECIALCYSDWRRTQYEKYPLSGLSFSWLVNIPQLFDQRAPGCTCLSALTPFSLDSIGTIANPINRSKGCGGVMRVAPVGLYFKDRSQIKTADLLAAEAAAITHGHELGYIPAAALAHIIQLVSHNKNITLIRAVKDMLAKIPVLFRGAEHIKEFTELIKKAVELSKKNIPDIEAIHMLGEGWVAEETLAISIYCALKYQDDFKKAIISAVNHKGDSDSTGAVTGNILGAYLGMSAIPDEYLDKLELKDVILELADDLAMCGNVDLSFLSSDVGWIPKYVDRNYKPK